MLLLMKLAVRPWKLAPLSQVFSAVAVGFLLLLAGVLFWIQQGLKPVLAQLRDEQVITAYLNDSTLTRPDPERAPTYDDAKIVDEIRLALGAHAERSQIRAVPPGEFLEQVKRSYPDLGRELEGLGPEMGSVIPHYITVSGYSIDSALEQIRAIPGIESAESSRDRNRPALGAFSAMRWVAKILSAGLCLALLSGLVHLARTNTYIHSDALSLLRLMGADHPTLRVPGIASATLVGALGGALAAAGWLTAGLWLCGQIGHLSPLLRGIPGASPAYGAVLFLVGTGIGLLAGAVCGPAHGES